MTDMNAEFDPFKGIASPKVMVGIPAYNEEKSIGRIVAYAKKYAPFVVVVNDCSKDKTVELAEAAGAFVISHKVNTGYGGGALTIFETAQKYQPDVLIMMDADGQHNPEDIPRFIEKIVEGYDVVIGSRYLDEKALEMIPFYRKVGLKALDTSTKMAATSLNTTDVLCGYRAFSKNAYSRIHNIDPTTKGCTEIIVQLSEQGMTFVDIPVEVRYDLGNTSKRGPIYMGTNLLSGILQIVSIKRPIIFFGIPGLLFAIAGVILGYNALAIQEATLVFPTVITLLAVILIFVGGLLCTAAIILFALAGAIQQRY